MTTDICTLDAATHTYRIGTVPAVSVSQVLEMAGLRVDFPGVPTATRQRAMTRGTLIHEACDFLDQGVLDWSHLEAECAEYRPHVEAYRRCRERERFQPDGPRLLDDVWTFEHRVWSSALGIAGQLDRVGDWDGRPTVVDLKHGSRVYWPTRYQVSLYAVLFLLMQGVPAGDRLRKAFADIGRKAIHLRADGEYRVVDFTKPTKEVPDPARDLDTVIGAIEVVRAQRTHRVRLPETEEVAA